MKLFPSSAAAILPPQGILEMTSTNISIAPALPFVHIDYFPLSSELSYCLQ